MEINDIDSHVETHLASYDSNTRVSETPEARMINLCQLYKAVKPVLKFARALLFWKHKWQLVLDQLTDSLDANCEAVG